MSHCRGMLSAAHILAMDAKNLLDVIDSIRIRYAYVDNQICQGLNDGVKSRDGRIRSSQSGEQLLRRSQSSERQGHLFRQSQSGDVLHRMGQSVDRVCHVSCHTSKAIIFIYLLTFYNRHKAQIIAHLTNNWKFFRTTTWIPPPCLVWNEDTTWSTASSATRRLVAKSRPAALSENDRPCATLRIFPR